MDLVYSKAGKPLKDRAETIRAMNALTWHSEPNNNNKENVEASDDKVGTSGRPPLSNVFGEDIPLVLSDIPESCQSSNDKEGGIVLGIDEAGRGSVVGPMVYGMSFWHTSVEDRISKEFGDSKQLTSQQRDKLYEVILTTPEMGFCARVLHASEISRHMLRAEPYNLNQMSHNAAIRMIRCLTDECQLKVQKAYIDTVGNPFYYKRRLEREFPGIEFVVESKADDKYAPCSAASIVAKVVRDRMLENWKFSEPALAEASTSFGSGYPSDPVCKKWMKDNLAEKLFGFPDVVRFSWGPAKTQIQEEGTPVTFAADVDDDEEGESWAGRKRQQEQMSEFLSSANGGPAKKKLAPFFERRKLRPVTAL